MGRNKLIAAQSVLTAILLGIVAVTLLAPEDGNDLFGVSVPLQPTPAIESSPSYEAGQDSERNGSPASRESDQATETPQLAFTGPDEPGAGTLGAGSAGETPTPPAPPSDEGDEGGSDDPGHGGPDHGDPPGDGDSPEPPGEQYGDTLSRLSDAID